MGLFKVLLEPNVCCNLLKLTYKCMLMYVIKCAGIGSKCINMQYGNKCVCLYVCK